MSSKSDSLDWQKLKSCTLSKSKDEVADQNSEDGEKGQRITGKEFS
jgi:hypothetical protein